MLGLDKYFIAFHFFSVSVADDDDAISAAAVNEIPVDEPISKESGAPLAVPRSAGRLSDKFSLNVSSSVHLTNPTSSGANYI